MRTSPGLRRSRRRAIPATVQWLESRTLLSAVPQFLDPHPEIGNQFGSTITPVGDGNVVVTSPHDDAGGGSAASGTGAGAIYLFNSQTGVLISTLKGSRAGDHLGSKGVTMLSNDNFVIDSPDWNGNRGAVTWGSSLTGVTGNVISAANSLLGNAANDAVGSGGVTALSSGNYVVDSPQWANVSAIKAGAVTFGNGTAGVLGQVSNANSLVGSKANDQVGLQGVTILSNGNYVVDSPNWTNGSSAKSGAATWVSGVAGASGPISVANSLVGISVADSVGSGGITALSNGNFVIDSPNWRGNIGAVTFANGTTGLTGTINAANSLLGSSANDRVGLGGVTALNNGNYVVDSFAWKSAIIGNINLGSYGAVTLGNGTAGVTGTITALNSLVGTTKGDYVGLGGVTALSNGNYVVDSSYWHNGKVFNTGAVTLGNGLTGIIGTINPTNSLVGTLTSDRVGLGGVTALTNGNYVVDSYEWNHGAVTTAGAVTFGNGTTGLFGPISVTNSLIGSRTNDRLGIGGVTALTNGNYVVDSFEWNSPQFSSVGAATWGNGTTGVTGFITAANSLIGVQKSDNVGFGGVTALSNGNYVVDSKYWNNGTVMYAGAVTWGSGTTGMVGTVSSTNSLVGTSFKDFVGSGGQGKGITALSNGNFIVNSDDWNNGNVKQVGAVTFGSGTSGVKGNVSIKNSLVGQIQTTQFDNVLIITPDNVNGIVYAGFRPPAGLGKIYLGTTATGFLNVTSSSSLIVSDYVGAIINGTGALNFGTATVGTPVTQTITVTNNGTSPLIVQPIASLPAGFSIGAGSNFSAGQPIAIGASVSVTIQLDSTAASTPSGIVTITSSDPTIGSFTFNVSGAVTPQVAPVIGLQQTGMTHIKAANSVNSSGIVTVDLGSTVVGKPVIEVITVLNTGNAALIVQPVIVPESFSVVAGTNFAVNQSIAVGASASFTIQLDATVSGTMSGMVTIHNNDPTANPFTFLVTGTVKDATTATMLQVQWGATMLANGASTVIFNELHAGAADSEVITVTNSGNTPLIVQPITTLPVGFSIVAGTNFTANQSIAKGVSARVTIQLNSNTSGTPAGLLTIHSNDPTASSFTFHLAANHAPTAISIQPEFAALDQTTDVVVGVLSATDPDTALVQQSFTYSIANSITSPSPTFFNGTATIPVFSIDGQGILVFARGASNGTYHISITCTDEGGLSVTPLPFDIFITAPSVGGLPSVLSVPSGTTKGFTVATFRTSAIQVQDALGNSGTPPTPTAPTGTPIDETRIINVFRYELEVGGDNSDFVIDSNGHLQTAVALDAATKNSYQIAINSTNTITGQSMTYRYTINVVPLVQTAIVVKPAIFPLADSSANGTIVGTISAAAIRGHTPTFAITGGNISGAFAINNTTGQITVANSSALSQATNPTFSLTVQATANGMSGSATITIYLAKVAISNSSVAKSAKSGTVIGQFSTTEAGTGNTFTYTLPAGQLNNTAFTVNASGQLVLNLNLNATVRKTFTIYVVSTDQRGLMLAQTLTITIRPV